MSSDVRATYEARRARHAAARERQARLGRRLSDARLAVFAGAIVAAAAPELLDARWPYAVAAALGIAFVLLVAAHGRARERERWDRALERENEIGIHRVEREWDRLPPPPPLAIPADHAYAHDLDLAGRASLWQLLGTTSAAPGRGILLGWLLAPSPPDVVEGRQRAVAELAALPDLRDALAAHARAMGETRPEQFERFLAWAEEAPWLLSHRLLLVLTWIVPVVAIALTMLAFAGIISGIVVWLPILVSAALTLWYRTRLSDALGHAEARATALRAWGRQAALVLASPLEAPMLRELQQALTAGGEGAPAQLERLERALGVAELRHSGMTHFGAQLLLLWDFHAVRVLERWRVRAGRRARGWLAALGEIEALAALAALRHDEPTWCQPAFVSGEAPALIGSALGHPLIPESRRVANDVTVGPPGTVLVISGSNMSGKSTLLRAIGLNAVLAHAGAPACATALRLPPVTVYTSMRIRDSLDEGVSFFMAELRRLRDVVDAARASGARGTRVLYLLDELLQGTNSAERQVAARTIIGHLVAHGAIGAVTTHDLSLADAPPLSAAARQAHFSETIHPDGSMTFGYRLEPGVATSVNAMRLVELMGLSGE